MNLHNAIKQFQENRRFFGNPSTEPEKYNLYAGLENLTVGLQDINDKLERIEHLLKIIASKKQ